MTQSNRINITPDPLPFWRRILRLGPSKASLRRDLATAVEHANTNADMVDALGRELVQTRAEHSAALARLERMWNAQAACKTRQLVWVKPAQALPRQQVLAEFGAPLDRGWQLALHQELDDCIQELVDQISQSPAFKEAEKGGVIPMMTTEQRLHLAGGLEHLRIFQRQLLKLNEDASAKDAELEEQE